MAQLELRDAAAFKRLVAKLVDVLPAGVLSGVLTAVGLSTIETQQVSAVSQQVNLTGFLILQGIASLLALAYSIGIWGWEARTGKTPGNLLLGLRTTDEEGHPPGWLAIFVRGLLVAVAGLVPVVGTVIMLVSNVFDADGKKQGWHDKAAHTRVFDVRSGRDPLRTGGIGGPASFAPAEPVPGLQPVPSPVPGPAVVPARPTAGSEAGSGEPAQGATRAPGALPLRPDVVEGATSRPFLQGTPSSPGTAGTDALLPGPVAQGQRGPARSRGAAPSRPVDSFAPPTGSPEAGLSAGARPVPAPVIPPVPLTGGPGSPASPASAPASAPAPAPAESATPERIGHPDDAVEQTRTSVRPAGPLKILFDNGREVELRSQALIGRNPAGQNGEMIDQLIDFSDQGRSVSKTHLHVRVEGQGLWVTDRNSTNGSAITAPDGRRTPVRAGETLLAQPGSTVHFGDRSFLVVRP